MAMQISNNLIKKLFFIGLEAAQSGEDNTLLTKTEKLELAYLEEEFSNPAAMETSLRMRLAKLFRETDSNSNSNSQLSPKAADVGTHTKFKTSDDLGLVNASYQTKLLTENKKKKMPELITDPFELMKLYPNEFGATVKEDADSNSNSSSSSSSSSNSEAEAEADEKLAANELFQLLSPRISSEQSEEDLALAISESIAEFKNQIQS